MYVCVPVLVLLLVSISWSLSCSLSALFLSSCSCRFKSFSCTHTNTHMVRDLLSNYYFPCTAGLKLLRKICILSLSSLFKFQILHQPVCLYLESINIYSPLHSPSSLKSSARPQCPLSPTETQTDFWRLKIQMIKQKIILMSWYSCKKGPHQWVCIFHRCEVQREGCEDVRRVSKLWSHFRLNDILDILYIFPILYCSCCTIISPGITKVVSYLRDVLVTEGCSVSTCRARKVITRILKWILNLMWSCWGICVTRTAAFG